MSMMIVITKVAKYLTFKTMPSYSFLSHHWALKETQHGHI
jgi:hypothetical protein